MRYQRPRGTRDILPPEYEERQAIYNKAGEILRAYGYRFVELPVFERLELFVRSIGEATDIVEKEMFSFTRGDETYALRPEGTAGAVRAFLEEKMAPPVKLAYWGPFFRAERPQKGRLRQFTQLGAECFGVASPLLDAEQIELALELFGAWGIGDVEVLLNSIGCPDDRARYRVDLVNYLEGIKSELCEDCKNRLERNPMRALDCKIDSPRLEDAPRMTDYLCDECGRHYAYLKEMLSQREIPFREEPRLWRGLDYYTRTVFEFRAKGLGAQDSVGGGGRYDLLVEQMGGPRTPASGWAIGVERVQLARGERTADTAGPDYFLVSIGPRARDESIRLLRSLRSRGLWVEMDYEDNKPGKQFKIADRLGAKRAIIIGDEELAKGVIKLRDMDTGEEGFLREEDLP
ncbi:MAG: histidine--tRNA ligase [candidate division WOR-3 bacterium]